MILVGFGFMIVGSHVKFRKPQISRVMFFPIFICNVMSVSHSFPMDAIWAWPFKIGFQYVSSFSNISIVFEN